MSIAAHPPDGTVEQFAGFVIHGAVLSSANFSAALAKLMSRIRIGVMTDNRLLGEGLRRLLSSLPDVTACEIPNARSTTARTHVFIADARALQDLVRSPARETRPPAPIIVLLDDTEDDAALDALRRGARGVLGREASRDELERAIRAVRDGQIWAPRSVIARALELLAILPGGRIRPHEQPEELSPRERDVACHVGAGLSNREIAARLGISEATVKAHLSRAFRKLGVRNRTGLVALQAARGSAPGNVSHRQGAPAPARPRLV